MKLKSFDMLVPLALALVGTPALANGQPANNACRPGAVDSTPSSLGADGWAAADGPVTGGCGAVRSRIHHVHNRAQLVAALTNGPSHGPGIGLPGDDPRLRQKLARISHQPKIIYVHGTIDLNVDDQNRPLSEEDYMRMCNYYGHSTYYDPVTGDQTGDGGFFGAYKAAYDPRRWIRQSLDPSNNRPPVLRGPLEEARLCFQARQAERVIVDVGSNTSIIGVGSDAMIQNGNLRIGFVDESRPSRPDNYKSQNVVIRNITFADAFDMFPGWDPRDSFSITLTNSNGCQAEYDAQVDSGPHRCVHRGGRWNAEYDSISVMNAEGVWVDGNTFTDEPRTDKLFPPVFEAPFNEATQKVQHHDGQVDVTLYGTKVTISNNIFEMHDKTNLLGGNDVAGFIPGYGPGLIDVTFHGNYFANTGQRMPRVRFGRVHVYNNYYDLDWRATAPYRLGDTWILGTAAKLVTENNVVDVRNNSLVQPAKLIGYSSNLTNKARCEDAGFDEADCGTYYHDAGTWLTTITSSTMTTVLADAFAAALDKQQANAANAPLVALEPLSPGTFWFPSQTYGYTLTPVDTEAQRDALRTSILANAGAGKL